MIRIETDELEDGAITNVKMADMAEATIKGRAAGSGTGVPADLTADQASAILDTASDPFARTSALPSGGSGYVLIEEATPSATGTHTFASLGAYRHLELRWSAAGDAPSKTVGINVQFNGDTGPHYDRATISSNGSFTDEVQAVAAALANVGLISGGTAPAGAAGVGVLSISDYRGTAFRKGGVGQSSCKEEDASSGLTQRTTAIHWRNTDPITSITVVLTSGNFADGSKLSLYGI